MLPGCRDRRQMREVRNLLLLSKVANLLRSNHLELVRIRLRSRFVLAPVPGSDQPEAHYQALEPLRDGLLRGSFLPRQFNKSISQIGSARRLFPVPGNLSSPCAIPTIGKNSVLFVLKGLQNGIPHALSHGRRSGAQRGAPENNFGQRFSWAPLAISGKPILQSLARTNYRPNPGSENPVALAAIPRASISGNRFLSR